MIYTSEEQLVFLVNGCVNVDNENIEECKTAIGLKDDTGVYNSKNQSEWDIRYNYLLYNAEKYGFQCVKIERTKLWTAIATFNAQTKELFLFFKERTLKKIMNKLSFYHFTNLKRYVPLLKSRDEFLGEKWLNIYNRSIYAEVPIDIHSDSLTSSEKLSILEYYFKEIAKKIQVGYTKKRGTGRFIGYPIKDYITNYRKREPKYITGNLQLHKPQNVNRYEFDDNFFIYDSAIINITEKQLIERISERVQELNKKFDEVYLIRMDENMHRESVKNEELKLHQFGDVDEIYLSGFQPDFILYLKNESFSLQMFIEVKGPNKEEEQWKEDLLLYISNHEDEIVIDEEYEDIKIKGVKFYTYNDGKDTIPQIGHITLGKNFESLSVVTKNDFTLE